jgi:uncharacterized protein (DUF952 family)
MAERSSAIFHIASSSEWADARRSGELRSSTRSRSLDEEGFIHCSDAHQVLGVANELFRDPADSLVVLRIEVERLRAPVRYERPEGAHESFPHVYGPVNVDAVVAVAPLVRGSSGYSLGDEVAT